MFQDYRNHIDQRSALVGLVSSLLETDVTDEEAICLKSAMATMLSKLVTQFPVGDTIEREMLISASNYIKEQIEILELLKPYEND